MWTADIGSWEKGIRINLPGANDLSSALDIANNAIKTWTRLGKSKSVNENSYVAQVYDDDGRIVFDYMNGGGIYT